MWKMNRVFSNNRNNTLTNEAAKRMEKKKKLTSNVKMISGKKKNGLSTTK